MGKLKLSSASMQKLKKFKSSGTYYRHINKLVKSECTPKPNQKTKQYELNLVRDPEYSNNSKTLSSNNVQITSQVPLSVSTIDAIHSSDHYDREEFMSEAYLDQNESEDEDEISYNLNEKLRQWAISFNISHIAITALLTILHAFKPNLPKSSRTLLKTPRKITIAKMGNGNYWHNGLEKGLVNSLPKIDSETKLELSFNIDGLPIYNSTMMQFWPILCLVNIPNVHPFVVGIYCGTTKPPSVKDFLTPFVEEIKPLLQNGIFINGIKCSLKIRCFICDTPARSFAKGVVNFNAYNGCTRCTVIGEYSHESHRMSFPRIDLPKRTDESFRNRVDPDHHKENSPLEELPINMVDDFPIGDSLHLLHLGIMKRCLIGWREGKFKKYFAKWSVHDTNSITNFLINCQMPTEIHRAVRGLDSLAFWKALEFRTFLHYIGPVILKNFLPVDVYHHFLMFFCAVTICSSNVYSMYLEVAESLLQKYVEKYIDLYGSDSITSNVHSLCHLVNDVKRFGELESFSAYPYESRLYQIKRLLRTGNNPLVQAAKRIMEMESHSTSQTVKQFPLVKKSISCNELRNLLPQCEEFFALVEVGVRLQFNSEEKNKWFLTKNDKIVGFKCASIVDNVCYVLGNRLTKLENFFETPIQSSHLNIYVSTCEEQPTELFLLDDVKCKLVAVKYQKKKVFIPLLHTLYLTKN